MGDHIHLLEDTCTYSKVWEVLIKGILCRFANTPVKVGPSSYSLAQWSSELEKERREGAASEQSSESGK